MDFLKHKNNNKNTFMLLSNEGIFHFKEMPPAPPTSSQHFIIGLYIQPILKILVAAQMKVCNKWKYS